MPLRHLPPGFVEYIRDHALAGQPCPTSDQIAHHFGWQSRKTADAMLRFAKSEGLLSVQSGGNFRVVSAPDGSWRTAMPDLLARYRGISVRRRVSRQSAAATAYRRERIAAGQDNALQFSPAGKGQSRRRLPPVTDEAEAQRLIAEALAAGRVTQCPARFVAAVNNGDGL